MLLGSVSSPEEIVLKLDSWTGKKAGKLIQQVQKVRKFRNLERSEGSESWFRKFRTLEGSEKLKGQKGQKVDADSLFIKLIQKLQKVWKVRKFRQLIQKVQKVRKTMLPVEPSPDHFRKELYANVFSTRPHAIGCINRDSKCRFLSRYVLFTKKCFKMRRQPLVQINFCNSGRNGSRMEWCYEMALGRKCILEVKHSDSWKGPKLYKVESDSYES